MTPGKRMSVLYTDSLAEAVLVQAANRSQDHIPAFVLQRCVYAI